MVEDKLVEKIANLVRDELQHHTVGYPPNLRSMTCTVEHFIEHIKPKVKAILSDPTIVEIDPDAELPSRTFYHAGTKQTERDSKYFIRGYKEAQETMLKAGWVKKK